MASRYNRGPLHSIRIWRRNVQTAFLIFTCLWAWTIGERACAADLSLAWQRIWASQSAPQALAFSPNGRIFAVGCSHASAFLLYASNGSMILEIPVQSDGICSLAFSPKGDLLAMGHGNTVGLWQTSGGALLRSLEASGTSIASVAFSPDGAVLAAAGNSGPVFLWNTSDWSLAGLLEICSSAVCDLAFSPDGRFLAVAASNGATWLFNAKTRQVEAIFQANGGPTQSIAFSPDSTLLAAAGGKQINVWRLADGWLLHCMEGENTSWRRVAFSPDGLAFAGAGSNAVAVYRSVDGEPIFSTASSGDIVLFSPDGRYLAVSGTQKDRPEPFGWVSVYKNPIPSMQKFHLTVKGGSGSGTYLAGSRVRITAYVPSGFRFVRWFGDVEEISDASAANTTVFVRRDTVVNAEFAPAVPVPGDVNGDLLVTPADVSIALRMVVGLLKPSASQLNAADLNRNGRIEMPEVLAIAVMASKTSASVPR